MFLCMFRLRSKSRTLS